MGETRKDRKGAGNDQNAIDSRLILRLPLKENPLVQITDLICMCSLQVVEKSTLRSSQN